MGVPLVDLDERPTRGRRQMRGNSGTCHCKERPSITAPSMYGTLSLPAYVAIVGRSPS
eukprot:CAMPEP_0171259204 /NCGR_PEP_ID=MMETSP0790-20130122/54803_1 /TAXON_ID=2925 /ORGANISM="Alexandrium catenella, Strain OF101" /LENGTH=57 /DNA_ID=CAMNT_0011727463 /DNA_START=651 /DNA_END=820 /DNA_ORIENTATION=+